MPSEPEALARSSCAWGEPKSASTRSPMNLAICPRKGRRRIYVPLSAAQVFFRMPEAVTDLEVFLLDADQSTRMGQRIAAALGGKIRLIDWQGANSTLAASAT